MAVELSSTLHPSEQVPVYASVHRQIMDFPFAETVHEYILTTPNHIWDYASVRESGVDKRLLYRSEGDVVSHDRWFLCIIINGASSANQIGHHDEAFYIQYLCFFR
jgi:hypothetical protein